MDALAKVTTAPSWQKAMAALASAYVGWKVVDGKYNVSADLHLIPKLKVLAGMKRFVTEPGAGVVKMWYKLLTNPGQADKVMFISADNGRQLTFGDVEALSNRVANWALSVGLKPGDVVAVMMNNCVEYVPIWLGLAKVRVIASLINNNTKGKPLVHSIKVANSKHLVFGSELAEVVGDIAADLRAAGVASLLSYTAADPAASVRPDFCDASLEEALAAQSDAPVDEAIWMAVSAEQTCLYIYTSGTTGLPKACKISHARMATMSALSAMFECTPQDVVYGSGLPLYHTAANLGVMASFRMGCTVVVRGKFSATQHWEDCVKCGATVMQYIGELCRYLIAAPPRPADRGHKVRLAMGNGMRPEIWDQFQRRFNVPEIGEFYGATEGNLATFNHCKNYEGQGAVGRAGPLMLLVRPMSIVKFDVVNEVPIRNSDGHCIVCAPDEAGELIAPIRKLATAAGEVDEFEGYTSAEATEKKILRDVFKKGDSYFRTGDLLRRDRKGYYYFVDRIGDTFRWKGENVSTMEVSEIVSAFPGIVDANVYGVEVPGKDGRACMAALTLEEGAEVDKAKFTTYIQANLPAYSIPVFVRFLAAEVNLTGTFKHQKVEYRNEGCDPSKISDQMWWFNTSSNVYESYGHEQYLDITSGRARL